MESNVVKTEVYRAADGYRWRAIAKNGEIVCTGEAHDTRTDAGRAATGVFPAIKPDQVSGNPYPRNEPTKA